MSIIVYTFIGMSKLFNIDNMNMNMDGGEGKSKDLIQSSDKDITEFITEKFNNKNNIKLLNGIMDEITGLTDKNKEGLIKYFTDNKNKEVGNFGNFYNKIRGVNETPPPGETEPQTGATTTAAPSSAASSAATSTSSAAPPATATGKCIHIGIIDENGFFVGVHNVSDTDKPLFDTLSGIANKLYITNQPKTNPVASIYDQFVKINTGCIPQFVADYEEKFCNSKELLELEAKAKKTAPELPPTGAPELSKE